MAEEPEAPSTSAGKGIGAKFTKKLGPLPVWAWGLGGAAAIFLVYRWYSAKNAASSAAASPASATGLGAGTSSTPGSNGYQDNGQISSLESLLSTVSGQLNAPGSSAAQSLAKYVQITPAQWAANVGNIYQQLTPGVFTKYTGAVSLLKSPGYVPINGQVSGAAAPTTGSPSIGGPIAGAGGTGGPASAPPSPPVTNPLPGVNPTSPPPAPAPVSSGNMIPAGPVQTFPGGAPGGNHIGPV